MVVTSSRRSHLHDGVRNWRKAVKMRLQWNDSLAVGDPLIDAQHRAFFDEINAVIDALDHGAPRPVVQRFHSEFVTALAHHFRDEEMMLTRLNYPELEQHQAEHRALLTSVGTLADRLRTADSPAELLSVVRNAATALIEHMALEDMRYRRYIRIAAGSPAHA